MLRSGHTRRQVTVTAKLAYIPVAATCHLVHPNLYCQKQYTVCVSKRQSTPMNFVGKSLCLLNVLSILHNYCYMYLLVLGYFPLSLRIFTDFFFSRSDSTLLLTTSQNGESDTYFYYYVMFGFFCNLFCIQF